MKTINKFLSEFYPAHPANVVFKNKFYPNGLTELQIYQYYLSNKKKLLSWIGDRSVAFLLRLEQDKTVLIRNQKGKPIYLNESNFDDLITGRTNVIYVTHPESTDYWVVDIDVGPNLNISHAKKALQIAMHEIHPDAIEKQGSTGYEAILTSPRGIHLIGYLQTQSNIDLLRAGLESELNRIVSIVNQKSTIKFTVNVKGRHPSKINFDLSSMYPNTLHMARYSLTKEFLICDSFKSGLKKVR